MSESSRVNIRKKKVNDNIEKWFTWRFEVFGKIKYKDLVLTFGY
jgi:hypothetical protein